MRDVFKLSITLALICAVAGASLAATYSVTSTIIEQRQQEELRQALGELFAEAEQFQEITTEDDTTYFLALKAGQPIGAVMSAFGQGYAGRVNVLVSIDMQGKVKTVRVSDHRETAGIGNKVEDPAFLQQFVGRTSDDKIAIGQDITTVSGATVTARAVAAGVRMAILDHQVYLLGMAAPSDDFNLAKVPDGTYEGTSTEGYKDRIDVEVDVQGGKITAVRVTYIDDTPYVADEAAEQIPKRIVEKQHWQVDVVSSATITSLAIMEAVKDAIPDTTLRFSAIVDGVYEGQADGYIGPIKVRVTVENGAVNRIEILEHKESDYVSDPAIEGTPKDIIREQSVDVDLVSGATWTSQGIIDAVINALENAPRK